MPENRLQAVGPPLDFAAAARRGRPEGEAGVTVALRQGLAIVSIAARQAGRRGLAAATTELFGCPPPAPGRIGEGRGATMVWIGPSQWLALAPANDAPDFAATCARSFAGLASVCDQSDGRLVISVAGPRALDALAKGVMLDLDPGVFVAGAAATTAIAKIGVTLWRSGAEVRFELAVGRSFFGSFWRFLDHSAAQYGLQVLAPLAGLSTPTQPVRPPC